MSLAGKVIKGSVVITAGEAVSQLCSVVRNVVLARLLTKADFGVAAMLGMTISLFEIGGRLAIDQHIVQAEDGDDPRFMAVAHLFRVPLGLLSGALIFFTARPFAVYFKVPDATWALQLIAVVPLLASLSHLDVSRVTRQMRFGPGVMSNVIPQIAITVLVVPLAWWMRSYAVLLWLLIGKQFASTVSTHFLAERKYRWAYDRRILDSIVSFGWPMFINGILMFGIMEGDRFAIGVKYTAAELGVYAVAGSIALLPAATLLRLTGSILLPLLSTAQGDEAMFRRRVSHTVQILALFSAAYAVVMIISGGPLVTLIFGAKYRAAGTLTALLGLAQALRLLRGAPTIGAMARGDTQNLMYSNLYRLSGVALAFPVAFAGGSLESIAGCAAIGEAVALAGSFWRFSRKHEVPMAIYLPACLFAATFTAGSAILAWLGLPALLPWIPLGVTALLVALLSAVHMALFQESRRLLLNIVAPYFPTRMRSVG